MTDREKLCTLLDSWGVHYISEDDENQATIEVRGHFEDPEQSEKVTGYLGFTTIYVFDLEGTFIGMGAWE